MKNTLYFLSFFCFILLISSCIRKKETTKNTAPKNTAIKNTAKAEVVYNEIFDNTLDIQKSSVGYIQLLQTYLKLDENQFAVVKEAIQDFRKSKEDVEGQELVKLKEKRNKIIAETLNKTQMIQKVFVDAKINNLKIHEKHSKHPIVIQKKLEISDSELLKLYEIRGIYKEERKLLEAYKRAEKIIGSDKVQICRNLELFKK